MRNRFRLIAMLAGLTGFVGSISVSNPAEPERSSGGTIPPSILGSTPETLRPNLLPTPLPQTQPAEPAPDFKNVVILHHLSQSELQQTMRLYAESLGVRCDFCHSREDFSLDTSPNKAKTREMIRMVQQLNRDVFKSERISCFTCHSGHEEPARFPEGINRLPSLVAEGKPRKLSPGFVNVQRLQHLTEKGFDEVMDFFTEALGVKKCFYCHNRGNYASDDFPAKVKARQMIALVQDLNHRVFGSDQVTCFTCHAGKEQPAQFPQGWPAGPTRKEKH